MKKRIGVVMAMAAAAGCLLISHSTAEAKTEKNTIHNGVHVGEIDLSGMTKEEARNKVTDFVKGLEEIPFSLTVAGGNKIETTAGNLGIRWSNTNVVDEADGIGREGSVLRRYKDLKDLEHEGRVYDLELAFDESTVKTFLQEECTKYDIQAENATLVREGSDFHVEGGKTGEVLDVNASAEKLQKFLQNGWRGETADVDLAVVVEEPKGRPEDLAQIKDLLGTYTTNFKSSGADRSANVSNGCAHINGTVLYPGEEFSAYEKVSPFSEENGYHLAGSYLNGMVVESLGGGICQVSTTLYNAVLRAELEVSMRYNHSMEVSYVQPSADAAIAESAGKDFRFVNNMSTPIYIEGYTQDKQITFNIYGVETRSPGHKVTFESEIISETQPDSEQIVPDSSQPIGFVKTQSVHVGRTAKLWKIVTEDGQEVSREVVNNSTYKMVPRTATVGIATGDPLALAMIQQAIATGSIDQVKATAAAIKNAIDAAGSVEAAQQAALAAQQAAAE